MLRTALAYLLICCSPSAIFAQSCHAASPLKAIGRLQHLAHVEYALRLTPGGPAFLKQHIDRWRVQSSVDASTLLNLVKDSRFTPELRAVGLRMLPAAAADKVNLQLIRQLLAVDHPTLRLEAIRTLQHTHLAGSASLLRSIAADSSRPLQHRAEAVLGLAFHAHSDQQTRDFLVRLAKPNGDPLQVDSIRSLRSLAAANKGVADALSSLVERLPCAAQENAHRNSELAQQLVLALKGADKQAVLENAAVIADDTRPKTPQEWQQRLKQGGNVAAGRRVFFHENSAGCFKCHAVNGRGSRLGPDLSGVGRSTSREKLIEAILDPSREIAPQRINWAMLTNDGIVHSGLLLDERNGMTFLATNEGRLIELKTADITHRSRKKVSTMPANLVEQLTVEEFRDLLAFLKSLE